MPRLHEVGEGEVLRRLIAARGPWSGVVVGPGDDAAVLAPSAGHQLVATVDAFVEGRHFVAGLGTPGDHGARLAAASLSDLAAMAARPRWALLSMGLSPDHDLAALLAFQAGVRDALAPFGAGIVGGNLSAVEGAEWFDLTLLGEAPAGQAWTRAGTRPGDWIAVTGHPGRAGAGLRVARQITGAAGAPEWETLLASWLRPTPRVTLALALAGSVGTRAAIDISDGLALDLSRLCEASGVGATLEHWPPDPLLERAAAALGTTHDALRFGPSDDYELILALSHDRLEDLGRAAAAHGVPVAFVGRVTGEPGRISVDGAPLGPSGFDHFRS